MAESTHNFLAVVTTIQEPTASVKQLVKAGKAEALQTIIIGDRKGPINYPLEDCSFFSLEDQKKMPFKLAINMPVDHYARKNIGYLEAIKRKATLIYETDDDNGPIDGIWKRREQAFEGTLISKPKWYNTYKYFQDTAIWPRGFPLNEIYQALPDINDFTQAKKNTPIQQGIHDGAPDVDAIWRLTQDREIIFDKNISSIILDHNTWAPFNSQSTWWWPDAYPLMYLPSTCTIRMTDIWRSYIAKRCLRELNMYIGYHTAEVFQDRNEHDLMVDFEHEMPGYLGYKKFVEILDGLTLDSNPENLKDNIIVCYKALTLQKFFDPTELNLLNDWFTDLESIYE